MGAAPSRGSRAQAAPAVLPAERKTFVYCVGGRASGKSSMLRRFENPEAEWSEHAPLSLMVDFKKIKRDCEGDPIEMMVWDMGGRERVRSTFSQLLRMAARGHRAGHRVIFLVFAADLPGLDEAKTLWDATVSQDPEVASIPKILLATKQDCDGATSASEIAAHMESFGEAWAGTPVFAVSAKTGHGTSEAMAKLALTAKMLKQAEDVPGMSGPAKLASPPSSFWQQVRKQWVLRAMEMLL